MISIRICSPVSRPKEEGRAMHQILPQRPVRHLQFVGVAGLMVGSRRRIPCIARGSGGPKRPTGRIRAESRPVARACASPTANSVGTGHNCVPQVDPCPITLVACAAACVFASCSRVRSSRSRSGLPCRCFSQGAASPSGRLGDIQHKIRVTQGKIGKRKGTERLLTTQISAYSQRIGRLQGAHRHPAEPAGTRRPTSTPSATSCSRPSATCAPSAGASCACAPAWRRPARRSPSASSSSTRPTSPTSSR